MTVIGIATSDALTVRRLASALRAPAHFHVVAVGYPRPAVATRAALDVLVLAADVDEATRMSLVSAWRSGPRPPRIVLVSPVTTPLRLLYEDLSRHAAGLLDDAASPTDILAAIDAVSQGHFYVSAGFQSRWRHRFLEVLSETSSDMLTSLTPRQSDVLGQLATGKSNPEIAAALGISRTTVDTHLLTIFRKLGVRNRTEAARIALHAQPAPDFKAS